MELIRQARCDGEEEEEAAAHGASATCTPSNREKSDEQMEENGRIGIEHGVRCGKTRRKLLFVLSTSHAHHEGF